MDLDHVVLWVSAPLHALQGARGTATEAFYFLDPDGNVLEARAYA